MAKKKSLLGKAKTSKVSTLTLVLGVVAVGLMVVYLTMASSSIAKYQDNDTAIKHGCGIRTTFTATNLSGNPAKYYAWKSPNCSNGSHAWYGPYKSLPQGDYWACYIVGFDKSVDFKIDITKDIGATVLKGVVNRDVPASRGITASPNGEWKQYCLSFNTGSNGAKNIEYRLWNNGANPVYVDSVEIYNYGGGHPYPN